MLTIFSEYVVHATGHAMKHKKYTANALFVNWEVLKSLEFYPKILTQGMIMDSFPSLTTSLSMNLILIQLIQYVVQY